MRRLISVACLVLVFGSPLSAGAADSPFTFPTAPKAPDPPAPTPGGILTLTGDTLYVINGKVDGTVRAHAAGLVSVTKEAGPLRIRGRFVDGNGKTETRTYPGPYVFVIEAVGTGRVELDVIPFGLKSDAEIATATIDVDAGQGPIPPPKPKPDPPKPDPPEPKPTPVTSFYVLLIRESGKNLTPAQNGVFHGKVVEEFLNTRTTKDGMFAGWRRHDKDDATTGDTPTMNALWGEVKPAVTGVPCVAIAVNGKVTIEPLPATPAEMVALLKKHLGEK